MRAILCSDLHLSLRRPRCRTDDWMEAQKGILRYLGAMQKKHKCPIIFAGDLFDHWKAEPELINFAIQHIPPHFYAIPGQHDLPLHSLDQIERSAFQTLVRAKAITRIEGLGAVDTTVVQAVPWGQEIPKAHKDGFNLLVAHKYVWMKGQSYPGAPEEGKLSGMKKVLSGYGAAVFGDNHKGFVTEVDGIPIMNCGTMLRRKSDEESYSPQIGLLMSHDKIESVPLEDPGARFISAAELPAEDTLDVREFLKEIQKLKNDSFDFRDAMEAFFRSQEISPEAKQMILEAMDEN